MNALNQQEPSGQNRTALIITFHHFDANKIAPETNQEVCNILTMSTGIYSTTAVNAPLIGNEIFVYKQSCAWASSSFSSQSLRVNNKPFCCLSHNHIQGRRSRSCLNPWQRTQPKMQIVLLNHWWMRALHIHYIYTIAHILVCSNAIAT